MGYRLTLYLIHFIVFFVFYFAGAMQDMATLVKVVIFGGSAILSDILVMMISAMFSVFMPKQDNALRRAIFGVICLVVTVVTVKLLVSFIPELRQFLLQTRF